MTSLRKTAPLALALALLTTAALAAPNGTQDPVARCANDALLQYQLDDLHCSNMYPGYATQLLGECKAQAAFTYSKALAVCSKATSARAGTTSLIKQNSDSGFLRRLRN